MTGQTFVDLLLALIVALFLPLGFWRGTAREVAVGAGAFLGAALSSAWAVRWGNELAKAVDLRPDSARFIVAMGLLLGAVAVGYAAGPLLGGEPLGLGTRLGGALVGAINGTILVAVSLAYIERYLADDDAVETMEEGRISRFLLREFEWVLLGVVLLCLVVVVLARITRTSEAERAVLRAGSAAASQGGGRGGTKRRAVRLPRQADDGKFEPAGRGFDPATGRYRADAPDVWTTAPVAPSDPTRWSPDRAGPRPDGEASWRNGGAATTWPTRSRLDGPEWVAQPDVRRDEEASAAGSGPTASWPQARARATPDDPPATPLTNREPRRGDETDVGRKCRICGGALGQRDVFCWQCGASNEP